MYKLLALFACLLVAVSGRYHARYQDDDDSVAFGREGGGININDMLKQRIFNKIPECKAVFGDDAPEVAFPECNEDVNNCIKEVQLKAQTCLVKEFKHWMKKPGAKACHKLHKDKGQEWFRAACKTHLGVRKCMAGEEPGDEWTVGDESTPTFDLAEHFKHMEVRDCWDDVKETYQTCSEKAIAECEDFGACAGKVDPGDDSDLSDWYDITRFNKHDMREKMEVSSNTFKDCLENPPEDDAYFFF